MRRFKLTLRDACPPATCDFIAHTAEAKFHIHSANIQGPPIRRHLRGQTACRGNNPVTRIAERVDHTNRLGVGVGPIARLHILRHIGVPFAALGLRFVQPSAGGAIAPYLLGERPKSQLGVTHQRQGAMLARIMARGVERDKLRILRKGRP